MAFVPQQKTPLFNIRYSKWLATMWLLDESSDLAMASVKAAHGEEEVKKGFTGFSGPCGRALNELKSNGVQFANLTGKLTGVRLFEREFQGMKAPYLSLTLSDKTGKYNLSVAIHRQDGVQMLIRKLANAKIGVETDLNLFATYGIKAGAERAFADHGAYLVQDGLEVPVIPVSVELNPRVDAAMAQLDAAGIEPDDKDTRSPRRAKIKTQYHVELVQQIQNHFEDFYKNRNETLDDHSPVVSQIISSKFEDQTDDIPY